MGVFGGKGLLSIRVQNCFEEGVHGEYMGKHFGMALGSNLLVEVVAKGVDHNLVAPPISDCPILDAYLLQHNYNQTHSQSGENS